MSSVLLLVCFILVLGSCTSRGDVARIRNLRIYDTMEEKDFLPVDYHETVFLTKKENSVARLSGLKLRNERQMNDVKFKSIRIDLMMNMSNTHNKAMEDNGNDRTLQASACDPESIILGNCFNSISACNYTCVRQAEQNYLDNAASNGTFSCDQYTAAICPSIAVCGCASCEDEYSDYYNCGQQACLFQCGYTPSPTPAPTQMKCPDELAAVQQCYQNKKDCGTCIDDVHDAIFANDDYVRCEELSDGICSAIKNECDCIECGQELENFYRCVYVSSCSTLNCNLEPTPSPTAPSPEISPPSPAAPKPPISSPSTTTDAPVATTPRSGVDQPSPDGGGGGISTGVIIGAIGGIVVVVGMIIGAILYSRRNRSNRSDQKPAQANPMDTSHDETEFNPPSTPGRNSQSSSSPASPIASMPYNYPHGSDPVPNNSNVSSSSNSTNPIQGRINEFPKQHQDHVYYNRHDYDIANHQKIPSRPSFSSQETDVKSSGYSAHSSSTSTQSRREYPPPSPRPSTYMPSNKDQCRTVLTGETIVAEAVPIASQATPMPDVASVTSNAVSAGSSSHNSKSRRSSVDP